MNPNNLNNYVGEKWRHNGRQCEAIGATVCGKILIRYDDGTVETVSPRDLRNEDGQAVIYSDFQ